MNKFVELEIFGESGEIAIKEIRDKQLQNK
jgi:hypothetical protein